MKSTVISSEKVFDGFVKVHEKVIEHDTYQGDPITIKRLVIEGGDSVSALVINPLRREAYLVEQYRATVDDWVIEAPAGMVKEGKGAYDSMKDEIKEELGVDIFDHTYLLQTHGSIGTKQGISHHYLAFTNEQPKGFHGVAEEGEYIKVIAVRLHDLEQDVLAGRITDPKIVIPTLYYITKCQ